MAPSLPAHPAPKQMSAGIEPGVALSFKSSADCVYTTLAFSALQSLLTAYSGGQLRMWHACCACCGDSRVCSRADLLAGSACSPADTAGRPGGAVDPSTHAPTHPSAPADWQQLHSAAGGGREMRALLAAGGADAMHVLLDNRLGCEAAMELDFGGRL